MTQFAHIPPVVFDYNDYYQFIRGGELSSPRGMDTWSRHDVVAQFPAGWVFRRPGDNPAIGLMEMLQFVGGFFDDGLIGLVAPNARLELFTQQSAYGPRTYSQFPSLIKELVGDPATRRAVIIVANRRDEPADRPCTTILQFQMGSSMMPDLDLSVYMRSSDTVWGLPYDLIQFSGVLQAVANAISVRPNAITMHIGNAHIYADHQVEPHAWHTQKLTNQFFRYTNTIREAAHYAVETAYAVKSGRELMNMFLED